MKVGLLWRREWDPPGPAAPRLQGVFEAFAGLGVAAEAVIYADDEADETRAALVRITPRR